MQKFLFVLFLFLTPQFLLAQTDAIQSIREHYQEIQSFIKRAPEEGMEGPIKLNKIQENVYNSSWRAVGRYQKTIRFWYDDQPGFACEEFGGNEACHLQFIEEEAHVSAGGWKAEYLFQNGELIFAYSIYEGGERRFYWQKGKLLRVQLDKEVLKTLDAQSKEEAAGVWEDGQRLRKKYMAVFQ